MERTEALHLLEALNSGDDGQAHLFDAFADIRLHDFGRSNFDLLFHASRLSPEEFSLVETFLQRRSHLSDDCPEHAAASRLSCHNSDCAFLPA